MMSAKENRFHSSPSGPHQTPPSVSTPSTSRAIAFRSAGQLHGVHARRCADAAQFLDDRQLALEHALHAVAHRLLDQADVAHQAA